MRHRSSVVTWYGESASVNDPRITVAADQIFGSKTRLLITVHSFKKFKYSFAGNDSRDDCCVNLDHAGRRGQRV